MTTLEILKAAREALPALLAEVQRLTSEQDQSLSVCISHIDEIIKLKNRAAATEAALEKDRTRIIDGVNGLSDALKRRQWPLTSRGSYEWDDERFVQEFRDAIEEIDKAVEPLRVIGADKSNCPQTTAEVIKSRIDLEAALAAAEAERDRLREFGKHVNWSLAWIAEYEEEPFWAVHECRGGRSDLEWELIGKGGSPEEAIKAALEQKQ